MKGKSPLHTESRKALCFGVILKPGGDREGEGLIKVREERGGYFLFGLNSGLLICSRPQRVPVAVNRGAGRRDRGQEG